MREFVARLKTQLAGAFLLGASLCGSTALLSCTPVAQNICDVASNREKFDGRVVRVSGYYVVGNQVGFFRSNECPSVNVGLEVLEGEDSRDDFLKEVWRGSVSDPLRQFPVEIEGKFRTHYEGREDVILVDRIRILGSSSLVAP